MPSGGFTLLLIPSEDGLDPDDEIFLDQVGQLRRELREAGVEMTTPTRDSAKGGELVLPIIETIVSGGGGLATVGVVVRGWIKRRGRRAVRLVIKSDGREVMYDMTAKNLSEEALLAGLKDILNGEEKR
jgi:hypothetical protein